MGDNELDRCPFCGSVEYQHEGTTAGELWFSCQGCGAATPISTHATEDDYTEAIKLANTRPIEDELRAEINRLSSLETALVGKAQELEREIARLRGLLELERSDE